MHDKRENLLHCINVYRSLPALWNTNDPQYTNRQAKNKAYDILLSSYKLYDPEANRETLVKKINSLRTNFRKELKKVENSKRSTNSESSGSNEANYVPTLWYYKDLMFLVGQETPEESRHPSRNRNFTVKNEEKKDEVVVLEQESPPQSFIDTRANATQAQNSTVTEAHIHTPHLEAEFLTHSPPKRKKTQNASKSVDSMYKLASRHLNKEDEFLILAKSYAQKLENMSLLQRLFADRLINEVLFEGQLGNLTRYCSIDLNSAIAPLTVQTHLCRSDLSRPSSSLSSFFSEGTTYSEHPKCSQAKPPEITSQLLKIKEIDNMRIAVTRQ